jgi:hypothetical protein
MTDIKNKLLLNTTHHEAIKEIKDFIKEREIGLDFSGAMQLKFFYDEIRTQAMRQGKKSQSTIYESCDEHDFNEWVCYYVDNLFNTGFVYTFKRICKKCNYNDNIVTSKEEEFPENISNLKKTYRQKN